MPVITMIYHADSIKKDSRNKLMYQLLENMLDASNIDNTKAALAFASTLGTLAADKAVPGRYITENADILSTAVLLSQRAGDEPEGIAAKDAIACAMLQVARRTGCETSWQWMDVIELNAGNDNTRRQLRNVKRAHRREREIERESRGGLRFGNQI